MEKDQALGFVGGGNRDLSDSEKEQRAQEIATAANSYERFAEQQQPLSTGGTIPVTVRDEDGNETTSQVERFTDNPVSMPEGSNDYSNDEADDDDEDEDE